MKEKYRWVRRGTMCRYWDGADCPCKVYGTDVECPDNTQDCFVMRRIKTKPHPNTTDKGELK